MEILDKKWIVTWDDVESFIREVIAYFREKDIPISGVYGIPRGGLILASILSYKMDIPMLMAPHRDCIIIDDIADSGETLLHYSRNTSGGGEDKGYHIVTMFYQEKSAVVPEYYNYVKKNVWIVYPWEE